MKKLCLLTAVLVCLTACSSSPEPARETPKAEAVKQKGVPNPNNTPDVYKVKFETTKGNFVIEVHRAWAPRGADRFHELVKDRFYDNSGFFRVVPNFVCQFGLAADPALTKKWDKNIDDDPVMRTNKTGSISFATSGPNTRTSQVFINLRSNQTLDDQGFAPFGEVIEGMEAVERIYKIGNQPDQDRIMKSGNAYLKATFPNVDFIRKATLL